MPMFPNSSNIIIHSGSFNHFRPSESVSNGFDILQRHVSADALHDSLERSNPPKCHPNTRTAILKDIISWFQDGDIETQALWLHGPAGAGKTAIAHSIAEISQAEGQLAAGFFFSRTAAGRNHDKCLIATIAYQITQSIPEARSFIEEATTKDPMIFKKSLSSQIRHLIVHPLKRMLAEPHTSSFPMLIVIDGLDECSPVESQTNILTVIHAAFNQISFPFRVLISSRAEPSIRDVFDSELADSTHRISLDDKYEPDQDIALYLRGKFSEVLHKHRRNRGMSSLLLPWPSEEAIQTLVKKASGQFIYAATVIRYVDVRHQRPDERLNNVLGLSGSSQNDDGTVLNPFTELDELYQQIFRSVVDISFASHLLGALLILKWPLPIDAFESLLGIRPGDVELALCNLHSVVRIPDNLIGGNHIGLYHASLGDFLFDSQRAGVYHIRMESAHTTLAESCLRKIPKQVEQPIRSRKDSNFFEMARRDDSAEKYAWVNWIHHFLNIRSWNDKVIQEFRNLPPSVLVKWLEQLSKRGAIDRFDTLKSWFIGQDAIDKSDRFIVLDALCGNVLDIYFKNAWSDRLVDSPEYHALCLGILAVVMRRDSNISSAALATLFSLNWEEFGRATFTIRPYIDFKNPVVKASKAFSDFLSDPKRVSKFNPNTPDIHADIVIRCVECISQHASGIEDEEKQDIRLWHWDPEGAYHYAIVNWKDHLRQAGSRRLLNYAYAVNARSGHEPICTHENQCHILCEVNGIAQCIESRIIDATYFPRITSTTEIKLLGLLKEIIAIKYLDTTLFSNVKSRIQKWTAEYLPAISRNRVHPAISSVIRYPSPSGSISATAGLTPDNHALLVIRCIECIAANSVEVSRRGLQRIRQQTLRCTSEGAYQYALSQWKDHLRYANPRRLLNYAYVINVRSGHQPICTHENECHILCEINGITRCIESRIIDGEFFPNTSLSVADMELLKLLREIMDVKYLQTPLFSRVNSRIQRWSADYRLAIAQSVGLKTEEAGPSTG